MLHLKTRIPTGAGRAPLRPLLDRHNSVLVVCASILKTQWERTLRDWGIRAEVESVADVMNSGFDFSDGAFTFDLVIVEGYPMIIHAPRDQYDGLSFIGYMYELSIERKFTLLELE